MCELEWIIADHHVAGERGTMNRTEIESNLRGLGQKLDDRGVTGEMLIVGGAFMILVLANRETTRDIDAYFESDKAAIRAAAAELAAERGLPEDWLNDAVKGFMHRQPGETRLWASYPGLNVYAPDLAYVFAMKAEAARPDSSDIEDLQALRVRMGLTTIAEALAVVERYLPTAYRTMRTQLTLETIFAEIAEATPAADRLTSTSDVSIGKIHLRTDHGRRTLCGRTGPVSTRSSASTRDPRREFGSRLCKSCRRSWEHRHL
jgi:hypothetical protein